MKEILLLTAKDAKDAKSWKAFIPSSRPLRLITLPPWLNVSSQSFKMARSQSA